MRIPTTIPSSIMGKEIIVTSPQVLGQEDHLTSNIEVQRLCQPASIDHSKSRPFSRSHRDARVHLTIDQGLKRSIGELKPGVAGAGRNALSHFEIDLHHDHQHFGRGFHLGWPGSWKRVGESLGIIGSSFHGASAIVTMDSTGTQVSEFPRSYG